MNRDMRDSMTPGQAAKYIDISWWEGLLPRMVLARGGLNEALSPFAHIVDEQEHHPLTEVCYLILEKQRERYAQEVENVGQ